MSISIETSFAFLTIDCLGLHAGWRGKEIAWVRGEGWVWG
jgi:hypothetical protein